jgi:uncharacterized phiE125 gp8 family phage protein
MGLKLITAPGVEPISRDTLKLHSRISGTDQDDMIDRYITAARMYCENRLGKQLINATWRLTLDQFPHVCERPYYPARAAFAQAHNVIDLPRCPLVSVTSVQYVDAAGVTQTLSDSYYVVDTSTEPGRLQLKVAYSWPVTADQIAAVTVTFVAGYGTSATDVPMDIRSAITMLAAHYYEHRETTTDLRLMEVPFAVDCLLDLHRVDRY